MSMLPGSPVNEPGSRAPSPEALLDALDPEQREVAQALRGPVRVLAGAGTGKTRAVTHRIAYGVATGVYVPTQVLAVTFTTRAAGEMRTRLRQLGAHGVQARTFHSAALRQARYFWPKVYGGELPQLMESKLPLVGTAARRNRVDTSAATLRDLASEIEWAKVSNVRPDDYARVAEERDRELTNVDPATVARVFASYEDAKRDAGRMDMEDVLLCAAAVLTEDERVAAEVRRQYTQFVVDEFQDVSPIQAALLRLWLGGRHDLCVVGDPAQTIYSFAGASARFLLDFPKEHPGTTSIELVRNYRSTPQVVEAANRVLSRGTTGGVRLKAQRPAGDEVGFAEHPDEVDEAEATAAEIRRLLDGGRSARDIAVLVRINAQTEPFEEALAARGVPYVVRGAERFFQRPEVRQAVTLLRGTARAVEDGGDDAPVVEQTRGVVAGMGWTPEAPAARGNVRDRWESLQALVDLAASHQAAHPEATLRSFVDDLDRRAAEQHAPVADGVTIATLHTAKGLEWDVVFLCGVVEGTLPITYALDSPTAVEEERRLLYVGMTRARDRLHLSWAQARNPGGRASRRPSRFLDGLRPETAGDRAREQRGGKQRKAQPTVCRICRAPLSTVAERKVGRCSGCPASYDEALFERLRTWRGETAKAESVPAYVVFTDLTLQAIAEVQPTSAEQLLRINGIGRTKREKYGDAVLELVATHSG
ncbi:UvrD-helicase domain-containing protein [Nocardioides caldifontis]|uniref:UvrD-helicase domain-containing protein n=1 Tax=Nocardioides caldifontis TaxID=2588938 RepID=UPI0011DF387A